MGKKNTYEYVKRYIESFNYKLLSEEYINNSTKLKIECDKGHKYEARFNDFQQGYRCPHCNGNIKLTYEYVKKYIESFGYELLSEEYKNNRSPLKIKCPNNHEYESRFDNFQQGKRCPYCNNCYKLTYQEVKEHIESFGYKLLSEEYINARNKLLLRCPLGHEFEMAYGNFQQGQRCSYCYGNAKYSYGEVKEYIESFGYELLSTEYKNNRTKLELKCPNEHIFNMEFTSFKNQNSRCPICNVSKGEQRIMDWLEENNIKYIYDEPYFNDLLSPLGNPLRPDFIIEDRKIWIEYDGEFHYENKMYEEEFKKLQIHDNIKNQYAIKNSWELIRIPYWDFNRIEEILDKYLK